ncbi:hypothetical protein GE09DRAFT_1231814 [Coniochaeta sp. 2T2.1]|nr:hypothetical protein GE09DRAFT_1231814 [Coniochaeta sp. 2T2.1]
MEAQDAITVASEAEEASTRRQRRPRKPSAKVRENAESQAAITDAAQTREEQDGEGEQATRQSLEVQMKEQTRILKALLEAWTRQEARNKAMQAEMIQVKDELQAVKEECQSVKNELQRTKQQMADGFAALTSGQSSPSLSYADVARTPPASQPSNARTLSSNYTTPSTLTNTLYCTIDTSRMGNETNDRTSAGAIRTMIESGVRAEQEDPSWRCRAVTKDPKNPHRIRIACRGEAEHKMIKRVAEAKLEQGGTTRKSKMQQY